MIDSAARGGAQVHLVGERGQVDADLVAQPGRGRSVQQVLGQRRPVVRRERFGAEHLDPAVEPAFPQLGDGAGGREAAADHQHRAHGARGRARIPGRSPGNGSLRTGGRSMVHERTTSGAGLRPAAPPRSAVPAPDRRPPTGEAAVQPSRPPSVRTRSRSKRRPSTRVPSPVRRWPQVATPPCGG